MGIDREKGFSFSFTSRKGTSREKEKKKKKKRRAEHHSILGSGKKGLEDE
jgi:hypothetical protein